MSVACDSQNVENTSMPRLFASRAASAVSRVLPMPGGHRRQPPTPPRSAIEHRRQRGQFPLAAHQRRIRDSGPLALVTLSSRRAGTGCAAPLMRTSCGSPSTAAPSTSREVGR